MPEVHPRIAPPREALPATNACPCHEPVSTAEESLGCRCHLDAARDLPAAIGVGRPAIPGRALPALDISSRAAGTPLQADGGVVGKALRGTLLAALALSVAAFIVCGLMPVMTVAFSLALVGLCPLILWALLVFATLDMARPTAAQPASAPAKVLPRTQVRAPVPAD